MCHRCRPPHDDLDAARGIVNAVMLTLAGVILGVLLVPVIFVICGGWR